MTPSVRMLKVHIDAIPSAGALMKGDVTAASLGLADSGRLSFKTPVAFEITLTVVKGRLLARGTVRLAYDTSCDRCLVNYPGRLAIDDYCQYFDQSESDEIDLTDTLREDILLALPQLFLCVENCAGLCPSCGANLNKEACACSGESVQSNPWGALDGFKPGNQ